MAGSVCLTPFLGGYTLPMASQGSRIAVLAALFANSVISVAKFAAAAVTGSAAMAAEGIHSVADSGNQGMLLWGMTASRRRGGDRHPFGRGKEVYFWSFMVAVMLFAGGAVFSVYRGVNSLLNPHHLENITVSVLVLAGSIAVESVPFTVAIREFNRARGTRSVWRAIRETKDAALLVVLLEDLAAMTGLLAALAGVSLAAITGDPVWDAVASITIGVLLAVVALLLAVETKALLVGEAADRGDRAEMRSALLSHPNVLEVERLLTMHLGPEDILVNADVRLAEGLTGEEAAQTVLDVERAIRDANPAARNIFVETVRG